MLVRFGEFVLVSVCEFWCVKTVAVCLGINLCVWVFSPSLSEFRLGPRFSYSPQTRLHLLCEAVPGFHLPSYATTQLIDNQVKSGLNTSLPTCYTEFSVVHFSFFPPLERSNTLFRIANMTLKHFISAIKTAEAYEIFIQYNNQDKG